MTVLGALGEDVASEVIGLSPSYLRRCSNPQDSLELSLVAAARLDAQMRKLGEEPVFSRWLGAQIGEVDPAPAQRDAAERMRRAMTELHAAMREMESYDPDGKGPKPRHLLRVVAELDLQVAALLRLVLDADDRETEVRLKQRERGQQLTRLHAVGDD